MHTNAAFHTHFSSVVSLAKFKFQKLSIRQFLHDPGTYSDPEKFSPERFIGSPGHPKEKDPKDYVFGFGRRYVQNYNVLLTTDQRCSHQSLSRCVL